ncbi:glycosyltransferase family 4 protein [Nesterenkonia sp.]|uniref:glycosyltransferase family 4 protein n=1 Tax=Nesterenkonia sp. TaxID=704201 RepID=UPI00262C104A|nr:glycosyltransferase family 4 protein [Nesterenkonia sp.]
MRIAYFLADPGIGIFGTKGASVHAQEMIRAFRQLGHEVTVYCTKRGNRAGDPSTEAVPSDLRTLPVFEVPVTGAKGAAEREQTVARASARMAALAADGGYDLLYERYSLFSTAGAQLSQRSGAPLVLEVNAPLLAEQAAHRSLHDTTGAMDATLRSVTEAALVSCVSEPVADWVRCLLAPEPQQARPAVMVTPNGVNTDRFTPSAGPGDRFTVGFLGTLKPWHGTESLLEAFASAGAQNRSSWRLEILGDGPRAEQLQSSAVQLGVADQVHFHGALPPEQVPQVLRGWDAGVAPYPAPQPGDTHYFSPLKVYEYMAAGLPTVASAVGELPGLIRHGVTGLLVPGSDISALAEALDELGDSPQRRRAMGAAARSEAEAHHSWGSRAAALLAALPSRAGIQEVRA